MRLEDRYIDHIAAEVAQQTGVALLTAQTPRAVIDLNRAPDDVDWSMVADAPPIDAPNSLANRRARSGLGLIPRRLPGLGEIWNGRIEYAELQRRINAVHRPYHSALGNLLERVRDVWGAVLLVDLHSMPPLKKSGPHDRPAEFVIGDRFGSSCEGMLSSRALEFFAQAERIVAHNRPYSGGYVLDRHGHPRRGVHAMQIEICRSAYLDNSLDQPGARAPGVARLLAGLVRILSAEVAAIGGQDARKLAAE